MNSIFGTKTNSDFVLQLKRVKLATTGNIIGTYNANTFVYAGFPLAIDGVNVTLGDRVLLKDQTDPIQNGIYKVVENGPTQVALVRTTDFQPSCYNSKILITDGNTLANSLWYNVGSIGFQFGIDDVVFIRDDGSGGGGGGTVTDGANVGGGAEVFQGKVGTVLDFRTIIAGTNVTVTQNADTIEIATSGTTGFGRLAFVINNNEIVVNNASYFQVGYMPWDDSDLGIYITGTLTFYAEINDQEIQYQLLDVVGASTIASGTTAGTGIYAIPITLPGADTYLELNVRNDGSAGTNYSRIYGIVIRLTI